MRQRYHDLMFTPAVRAAQAHYGSREVYAKRSGEDAPGLGPKEAAFLAEQDGFYLASVSQSGWPYVQFRGGPEGFLTVLDAPTVGWADYRGNRQYITVGNVSRDDRVALIVLDYARQARIKIMGRMTVVEAADAPELVERLRVAGTKGRIERAVTVAVEAFDWNCPQHITQRFTAEQLEPVIAPMRQRIAELEAQLAAVTANAAER